MSNKSSTGCKTTAKCFCEKMWELAEIWLRPGLTKKATRPLKAWFKTLTPTLKNSWLPPPSWLRRASAMPRTFIRWRMNWNLTFQVLPKEVWLILNYIRFRRISSRDILRIFLVKSMLSKTLGRRRVGPDGRVQCRGHIFGDA